MYGSSSSMYHQSGIRRSGGASSFADRTARAGNNIPHRTSFNANSPMTVGGTYGKESTQKSTTLAHAARNGVMGASSKSS